MQDIYLKDISITHTMTALLLSLAFKMEYPNGVSDAVNIFMFPDLYLAARTEAVMIVQR